MNEYDERYEIRIAQKKDIPGIMDFIQHHWREDHIMAKNRSFFEYEFLEEDGTVNFILAIDKTKGTIEALNGVLKASHDSNHLDIFGSFWKSLSGNMAFLGLELIKRKNELFGARTAIGVGDNPMTSVPLMKILHRYTAKMQHYYKLADREDFKIAKIQHKPEVVCKELQGYSVKEYFDIEELKEAFDVRKYKNTIPYKDDWYINHRFFQHPIYNYHLYGIEKEGKADAVFVLRNEHYNERIAIRMVDFIGNEEVIPAMGSFLEKMLQGNEVEYIDFYCDGFDRDLILRAGFTELEENDTNIIPNYFGPFVQRNIDIFVSSSRKGTRFTKADADQDRPN